MKKVKNNIKIAHLYYDLMNLYGENGNVRALKRFIERQGVDAKIKLYTIGDKIDFEECDFYYIGCGSEDNQRLVLEDLMKYKDDIKKAVDNGKMFLATGNSMELFGKKIRLKTGQSLECLGIFPYQAYEEEKRLVNEIIYEYKDLPDLKGKHILGFKNCNCNIVHNDERLFEFPNTINHNEFYGMNFVGPFLIRNPYFTNMLLEKLFKKRDCEYKSYEDSIEFKAYQEYIKNFVTNGNLD